MEMRHKWVRCPGRLATWEQDCGSNMHAGGFWGCKGNSLDHTVHEEGAFLKLVSPSTPWFVGIDDPQNGPRTYLLLPALKFVVLVFECMDWEGYVPAVLLCSSLCMCVKVCAHVHSCIRGRWAAARDVMQILTGSSFAVSSEGSSILWRFCRRINHKGRRPPESSFQCWDAEGPQPLPPCHGKAAGDTGHFVRGPRAGVGRGGMTSAGPRRLLTSGNQVC